MTDILILYIDSDFIYPVVADGHGAYERYEHPDRTQRDFRLWLYFEEDLASSRVTWTRRARAGFFSGNPVCRGGVFSMFGSDRKAEAERLLSGSGLIAGLKAMYSAGGRRPETDIPTAYVFASNIAENARREFIAYMQGRSFATISFTVSIESLSAAVLAPEAEFGDKLLAFASSGNDLICSGFIYDAPEYMLAETPEVMPDLGYNPLREALVNYVLNRIEGRQHFLVNEQEFNAELEYQKQFVDDWLRDINLSDAVSTIAFRYNNRGNEYLVQVEADMLKNRLNEFVERLLQEMNSYRNRAARYTESPVNTVVLIGDMFDDADFRSRVAASVGRGADVRHLPVKDFASVLSAYPALYPQLRQRLDEFERIARLAEDKTSDIQQFIDNADTLRSISDEASELAGHYDDLSRSLSQSMDAALKKVEELLAQSNFNGAEVCLNSTRIPEGDNQLFTREDDLTNRVQKNRHLLSNENAKGIAEQINASLARIASLSAEIKKQLGRADALRAEISRLRDAWPEYQQLLAEFEVADVIRKRNIVDNIRRRKLTREPLPATGLTMPFLARIEASVSKSGGFLGFFVKKSLKVSVLTAEDYRTECKTVVLVQDRPLVSILPGNIRATIEAGFTGRRDLDPIPIPLDGNSSARHLYIYLVPAPDEAIGFNDPYMTVPAVTLDI